MLTIPRNLFDSLSEEVSVGNYLKLKHFFSNPSFIGGEIPVRVITVFRTDRTNEVLTDEYYNMVKFEGDYDTTYFDDIVLQSTYNAVKSLLTAGESVYPVFAQNSLPTVPGAFKSVKNDCVYILSVVVLNHVVKEKFIDWCRMRGHYFFSLIEKVKGVNKLEPLFVTIINSLQEVNPNADDDHI